MLFLFAKKLLQEKEQENKTENTNNNNKGNKNSKKKKHSDNTLKTDGTINKLIEEHNVIITECINICENSGKSMENSDDNDKKNNENEKMWFDVLQIFYEYILAVFEQ